jgi:hypothetical protein
MSQQAGAAAAKVVKDSSSTVTIIVVLVLLLVAGIGVSFPLLLSIVENISFNARTLFLPFHCALTSSTPSLWCRTSPPAAQVQFFAYTRYSQIEFIEKKKLGAKKAKRTAEEERKKAPRNIQ